VFILMNLSLFLQQNCAPLLREFIADPGPYLTMIKPAQDARHGDYQANFAMSLAKVLGRKPQELARELAGRIPRGEVIEAADVAGPGFINLRLSTAWLANKAHQIATNDRLGVEPVQAPRTLVLDFSSPNVAKPMHVGHLRSTIIGDALARLFRFLGHRVITDNHLGDWGTQFGVLLYGYKRFCNKEELSKDPIRELARIYIHVRDLMKAAEEDGPDQPDDPITQAVRLETAKLHAGDPDNLEIWRKFMPWCLQEIEKIYKRLDVHFDFAHGESFYQPMLPEVVASLKASNVAQESEGAVVVFLGPDDPPALVRKTDGAFTYTTTDLATIRYRMEKWHPQAMLYVVDSRQELHFKNLFETARRWGYTQVDLEHIAFGSVLGADRKPIKTREGGAVELEALLDEAVEEADRAYERARNDRRAGGEDVPELVNQERRRLAEVVGIGAVKYADLSQNRTSDYVFSWDKMLAMDGNTATYMQYAYARIRSIFRKGQETGIALQSEPPMPVLASPAERALALQFVRYEEALDQAAADYKPNIITGYLWDLARAYSGFYQACPVLKAETADLKQSRLLLCDLTARLIQHGLSLLGIQTIERM
jgi:arginyl-tRNA synthetase